MNISEVIHKLSALREEHGDLPVVSFQQTSQGHEPRSWDAVEIDDVYYNESRYAQFKEGPWRYDKAIMI